MWKWLWLKVEDLFRILKSRTSTVTFYKSNGD